MRSICRAAQVRRAWRDASSDLAASAIWWKQCVISWPSTAVPMAKYGSASTAAGADWSARAVGAATSAQRRKEQEAHGQAQGTVTAMLAAADAGERLLSDPRRLFRGMTLAMRTGLDVVRPVSLSRSPSLPPSLPPCRSLSRARALSCVPHCVLSCVLSVLLYQSFWLTPYLQWSSKRRPPLRKLEDLRFLADIHFEGKVIHSSCTAGSVSAF